MVLIKIVKVHDHAAEWSIRPLKGTSVTETNVTCCSVEASRKIVEQTKLFKVTVSFGSVTSLISLPCYMSHASIPAEVRAARGLPDDLIRISAGIEDPEDLLSGVQPRSVHEIQLAFRSA